MPISSYAISNFVAVPVSYGYHLKIRGKGCLVVFGTLFFLIGLCMLAALSGLFPNVTRPPEESTEAMVLAGLAFVFVAAGFATAFYTTQTEIDFHKMEIRMTNGYLKTKTSDRFPLAAFEKIEIGREVIEEGENGDEIGYSIKLVAKNGHDLILGNQQDLPEAVSFSLKLAGRLGIKVHDASTDADIIMTPDDVHFSQPEGPSADSVSSFIEKMHTLNYVADTHAQSLAQLSSTQANGNIIFRLQYPKYIVGHLAGYAAALSFFMYFFGWRIDIALFEIISGFFKPDFLASAETFFVTIITSFFALFLVVIPSIRLVFVCLKDMPMTYIILMPKHLVLYDKEKRMRRERNGPDYHRDGLLLPYEKIKSMDIKLAPVPSGRKQWKLEMRRNFIALRAYSEFYEVANGLNEDQLRRIAGHIRDKMMRD